MLFNCTQPCPLIKMHQTVYLSCYTKILNQKYVLQNWYFVVCCHCTIDIPLESSDNIMLLCCLFHISFKEIKEKSANWCIFLHLLDFGHWYTLVFAVQTTLNSLCPASSERSKELECHQSHQSDCMGHLKSNHRSDWIRWNSFFLTFIIF